VIKVYTEDDHLSKVDDNMKELYGDLISAILSLGKDIELRPKKFYISFRRKQGSNVSGTIFSNIHAHSRAITIKIPPYAA
jgi:predicted transport protein